MTNITRPASRAVRLAREIAHRLAERTRYCESCGEALPRSQSWRRLCEPCSRWSRVLILAHASRRTEGREYYMGGER